MRYKRIGYNLSVMRQSACLVINPITVDGYAALFNCTPVDPSGKHLRTKVTPDFHLTYSKKWGKSGVGIKMIKMDNFHRGDSNTHPKHMILWRTYDNLDKNTGLL